MSDKLKTCPWCKGEAKITRTKWVFSKNQIREAFAAGCDNDSKKECPGRLCFCRVYDTEAEAIAAWNTRADDAQIAANDNLPAETDISADGHVCNDTMVDSRADELDCGTAEGCASQVPESDSRERLEADLEDMVRSWCADDTSVKATRGVTMYWRVKELLNRQAAITEREVEHDLMLAGHMAVEVERKRIAELTAERDQLQEQHGRQANTIERLTAKRDELREQLDTMRDVAREFRDERDELQSIIDHMPKTEAECEACQDAHDRLMFNAKVDMDKLRDELKHKQHVCDVQRDSFAKLERENRELQDVCGELERTLENLRGD